MLSIVREPLVSCLAKRCIDERDISGYTSLSDDHVCASTIQQNQAIQFVKPAIAGQIYNAGTPIVTKAAEPTVVKGDGIPIWWQSTDAQKLSSAAAATSTRPDNFSYDKLNQDCRCTWLSEVPSRTMETCIYLFPVSLVKRLICR